MSKSSSSEPSIFIIFGAAGDLSWRKLMPALYNLFLDKRLPEKFEVIGVGHGNMSDDAFRNHIKKGVRDFSLRGNPATGTWKTFSSHLKFLREDLGNKKAYTDISKKISDIEEAWKIKANRIFYLALPPGMMEPVAEGLANEKFNRDRKKFLTGDFDVFNFPISIRHKDVADFSRQKRFDR